MDFFSKLIEIFDKDHKWLLISIIVLLPFSYTCLYLCAEGFTELDYFVQIVFSITASIIYVLFIAFSSAVAEVIYGKRGPNILGKSAMIGCFAVVFTVFFVDKSQPDLPILFFMFTFAEMPYAVFIYLKNHIVSKFKKSK